MNIHKVMAHLTKEYTEYCDRQERLSYFYNTVGMTQEDICKLYDNLIEIGLLVTYTKEALYIIRNPNKTGKDLFKAFMQTTN